MPLSVKKIMQGYSAQADYTNSFSRLRQEFRSKATQMVAARLQEASRRWDALPWTANEQVSVGMCRLPTIFFQGNNTIALKIHRCITAGITSATEPTWATADYHVTPGSSDTTDGGVTWRAYNIYFFDSVAGNDTTGDGSQLTPWASTAKTSAYGNTTPYATCRSGRALAFKRGSVFSSGQTPGDVTARILIHRDTSDTQLNPERINLLAYGLGPRPVFDMTGLRMGIRAGSTGAARHQGFCTISGLEVRGDASTTGGSAIYAGWAATTDNSTPASVKVINCRVNNITCNSGTEVSGDINGIQLFGSDNGVYGCQVSNVWDDGLWLFGPKLDIVGNYVSRVGISTSTFPNRTRGDGGQINSSAYASNGDTPMSDVYIGGNVFDHSSHSQKHALIVNPECTGTDRRSNNYVIEWNDLVGYSGSSGATNISLYLSGFNGEVRNNLVQSGHTVTTQAACVLFAGAAVHNNVFLVTGGMRAIELGTLSLSAGAVVQTSNGAEVFNNTFIGPAANTCAVGVTFSGSAKIHSNAIFGFGYGIDTRAGVTHGYNTFVGTATDKTAGSAASTALGNDTHLNTDEGFICYRPISKANISYGLPTTLSVNFTDITGVQRDSATVTPGALEAF